MEKQFSQGKTELFQRKTQLSQKVKPGCSKERQNGVGAEMCYVSIRNPYGIHTDLCVPQGFGSSSEAGELPRIPQGLLRDSYEALGPHATIQKHHEYQPALA